MSNMKLILENKVVKEFLKASQKNNWAGTPFEKYPSMHPKIKGGLGELIVQEYMRSDGHIVQAPSNTDHDRIINGRKCEIKFGLATSPKKPPKVGECLIDPDSFMFNHIATGKDWDILIFCGINPCTENKNIRASDHKKWPKERVYVMHKKDFLKHLQSGKPYPFQRQQGGKKGANDDWMISSRATCLTLFDLPFVKEYKGEL